MAAKIKGAIPGAEVQLIRGGKGDFIVIADGDEMWNKNGADGGFPNEGALVDRLANL